MSPYAQDTQVPVERSMSELVVLVKKHGATQTFFGESEESPLRQFIMFKVNDKTYRVEVPIPPRKDFTHDKLHRYRGSDKAVDTAWNKEKRRRWRVMVLLTKAQLEAVEIGMWSFETAMMPHLLLPGGHTAQEAVLADLNAFLAGGGRLPLALPAPSEQEA